MRQSRHRPLAGRRIVFAGAAAGLLLAWPAAAQEPVVVGGSGEPPVQVNLDAIGGATYGPGPAARELRMPNAIPRAKLPVTLRPPGQTAEKPELKAPTKKTVRAAPGPAPTPEAPIAPAPAKDAAAEPPAPPAKKAVPVEAAPLPPASAPKPANGTAAAPPPPPPAKPAPPAESAAKPPANGAGAGAPLAPSPPAAAKSNNKAEAAKPAEPAASAPPPGAAPAPPGPPPPPPPPPESSVPDLPALQPAAGPRSSANAQVAALTAVGAGGKPMPIAFAVDSSILSDSAKEGLDALAAKLNANPDLRLQIVAYATGGEDNASQARRLSLARALAVRWYLGEAGIKSTRMDVRALGNKFESGPGDRVDLIVVKP